MRAMLVGQKTSRSPFDGKPSINVFSSICDLLVDMVAGEKLWDLFGDETNHPDW